ncbi:hypothetical protein CACET_c06750 [Clostridium aceticum]|uniref:Uncharacterized protein n=1 Tax=Clostridium aceticum TaxID=84022 RepID=A0A0D8IDX0_9CLOT|nr:DUF2975 domain-containing protein [Clostridium aceticum]AKL94185.1 hypothetical protein CACET_c06750 [Clostridium aceticum]KJF28473.1 hypothetical protein TZ02_00650 [Clostridium aceticum]
MKYYGKKSLSSFLKIVLDVLLLIGVVLFVSVSKNTLFTGAFKEATSIMTFVYFLFLIGSTSLIAIVYSLRKITKTLVTRDPFVWENVKSLKNIWIGSFIIAVCYFINFFINPNYKDLQIIYIDAKGIHTDFEFFIFFFAGLFILVLEKVFKMAVQFKEENDLTI